LRKLTLIALLTLSSTALDLAAQAPAATAPVLIPVFFGESGEHGSEWRTVVTIHNEGDRQIAEIPHIEYCPIPEGCPMPLAPHSTMTLEATPGFRYTNGFILYPRAADAPDLSYSVRVRDVSKAADTFGTNLPVVPLSALRETPLQVLDLPGDARFRLTLRIYGLPNDRASVSVKTYRENVPSGKSLSTSTLMRETLFQLSPSLTTGSPSPFQRPSGLMTDLSLTDFVTGARGEQFRVTVTSISPGQPVWTMITATNNDTQQVTAFWPQP
jgi:hypothetical protein